MHIMISDDYQNCVRNLDCFALLKDHQVSIFTDTLKDVDALAARFQEADAIVIIRDRTPITRALLSRLPKLKLISQGGGGAAHIDLAACKDHGVTVRVAGTSLPDGAAELTWALLLASARRLVTECNRNQQGLWQGELGQSVKGRTLGLVGYGAIAQLVAGYARVFGMNTVVLGHRASTIERAHAHGLRVETDRAQFFSQCDFVSLHLRANADTKGFVTLQDLLMMKPDAHLINTGRSSLIETGALERALDQGRPGFAAVDVYDEEPILNPQAPLLGRPNVLCSPHIGFVEKTTYEAYLGAAFRELLDYI